MSSVGGSLLRLFLAGGRAVCGSLGGVVAVAVAVADMGRVLIGSEWWREKDLKRGSAADVLHNRIVVKVRF